MGVTLETFIYYLCDVKYKKLMYNKLKCNSNEKNN